MSLSAAGGRGAAVGGGQRPLHVRGESRRAALLNSLLTFAAGRALLRAHRAPGGELPGDPRLAAQRPKEEGRQDRDAHAARQGQHAAVSTLILAHCRL